MLEMRFFKGCDPVRDRRGPRRSPRCRSPGCSRRCWPGCATSSGAPPEPRDTRRRGVRLVVVDHAGSGTYCWSRHPPASRSRRSRGRGPGSVTRGCRPARVRPADDDPEVRTPRVLLPVDVAADADGLTRLLSPVTRSATDCGVLDEILPDDDGHPSLGGAAHLRRAGIPCLPTSRNARAARAPPAPVTRSPGDGRPPRTPVTAPARSRLGGWSRAAPRGRGRPVPGRRLPWEPGAALLVALQSLSVALTVVLVVLAFGQDRPSYLDVPLVWRWSPWPAHWSSPASSAGPCERDGGPRSGTVIGLTASGAAVRGALAWSRRVGSCSPRSRSCDCTT